MHLVPYLAKLGSVFRNTVSGISSKDPVIVRWANRFKSAIPEALASNPWFTEENMLFTLEQWGQLLQEEALTLWLSEYDIPEAEPKKIALVLAGNIPMVGFHDLLAVWVTGNTAIVKYASKDAVLLPVVVQCLEDIAPEIKEQTVITSGTLGEFDAVIATGSNNTGRYFRYYFSQKPHIIRNNRTSLAILKGDESKKEIEALGNDVFRYFGLGCRNVSKIFLPVGYNLSALLNHWEKFASLTNHNKYANNYHYQKSVWLMNRVEFTDSGFVLIKEDKGLFAPLATLYVSYYKDYAEIEDFREKNKADIQCVVGPSNLPGTIPFGTAQSPALDDYADKVDTVDFLLKT